MAVRTADPSVATKAVYSAALRAVRSVVLMAGSWAVMKASRLAELLVVSSVVPSVVHSVFMIGGR